MGEGNRSEGYKKEGIKQEGIKQEGIKQEGIKQEGNKKVGYKKEEYNAKASKNVKFEKNGHIVRSEKPEEPSKSVGYRKPEGLGKPIGSSKPEGSSKPIGSGKPIGSSKPIGSGKPMGSSKPIGSGKPEGSGKSGRFSNSGGYGKSGRLTETGENGKYRETGQLKELGHRGKYGKSGAGDRNPNKEGSDRPNNDSRDSRSKENSFQKKTVVRGSCPYLKECGGCNILKQSYEEELKGKQKLVQDLIKKYCSVEPIIGMKQPNYYRNKVHVVFDHDKKGNPISGVYQEGTHRVIPVEKCLIHNEKADAIIATIRGMLKSFKIKTYDEDTGYGLLRHVLIRTGFASGEIMVVLVLASPIMPSKNNFVKALLKEHPEITTIVISVNDKATSMVLGNKEQVIYGKGFIEDYLCGKVFRISPKSFYQVNPAQTEVLYAKAIDMAELTGTETIIDAYCGIGTIGIIASDRAKKVIGVELNKDAFHDAHINTRLNGIKNMDIYNNDAGVFMSQMAEQKETAEVVFMDPPRAGSTEQFMDAIVQLKPKKVIYISCNPVTLERDLQYMKKKGYKAQRAIPVDMFPWTGHVETVVLMSRKDN